MRYHVPFEHRQRTTQRPGPVYIGFDEPVSIQKRKQPFNWCGFTGTMLALISPITLFLIAPIALFFSFLGLRRRPRSLAVVGLVLSLLATTALSLGLYQVGQERHERYVAHQQRLTAMENYDEIKETRAILAEVQNEFREFRKQNNKQLPNLNDGMMMTVRYDDAWGEPLRYGVTSEGCTIRSKGPDREFNTGDDLTVNLDGLPMTYQISTNLDIDADDPEIDAD